MFELPDPRIIIATLLLFGSGASGLIATEWGSAEHGVAATIEMLDSESFHDRSAAADRLFAAAVEPTASGRHTRSALRMGRSHHSLEVRLACNAILDRVQHAHTDRQIQSLLNPTIAATEVTLPGWDHYRCLLGDDMLARSRFASLTRQYPQQVHVLDPAVPSERRRQALARFDPYRLAPHNIDLWTLLLLLEIVDCQHQPRITTARSCLSLGGSHLGPDPQNEQDRIWLRRVVDRWVASHQGRFPDRQCLLISMKYECRDRVDQIANEVLNDAMSPPATQVMAMLCAAAMQTTDHRQLIESRLTDERTAHVWQLVASRKIRIQTQVRDVALALLLHEHGIDPRSVGFHELQADPMLVYQDHSLGFTDQTARLQAHQAGLEQIGRAGSSARAISALTDDGGAHDPHGR